jgi:hypothetical protein
MALRGPVAAKPGSARDALINIERKASFAVFISGTPFRMKAAAGLPRPGPNRYPIVTYLLNETPVTINDNGAIVKGRCRNLRKTTEEI